MIYTQDDYKLAEEYTKISIGMDNLFRRTNIDSENEFKKEGLLPVILTEIKGTEIENWEQAIKMLNKILKAYSSFSPSDRKIYIMSQIDSTIHLAKWLNNTDYTYLEKIEQFLAINSSPLSKENFDKNYLKLKELLKVKYNISGEINLKEYVEIWKEEFHVSDIEKVGNDYLIKAKNKMLNLGFTEVENINVTMQSVNNVPYNAYCDFYNNKIYLNSDLSYTTHSLKHLAVHEAFPGHSAHLKIRESKVKSGEIPLDASLVFTNTASSVMFEGLAENGLFLLDWIEDIDDEIYYQLQIIKSKVALNAAYKFHVEKHNKEFIIDYLIKYGLENLSWANSRFKFISHKFRGPFIYSYWKGQELVRSKLDELHQDEYTYFYRHILENMHSSKSLILYK